MQGGGYNFTLPGSGGGTPPPPAAQQYEPLAAAPAAVAGMTNTILLLIAALVLGFGIGILVPMLDGQKHNNRMHDEILARIDDTCGSVECDDAIVVCEVPYIINEPGTYRLCKQVLSCDLSAACGEGYMIWINSSNVVLDGSGAELHIEGVGLIAVIVHMWPPDAASNVKLHNLHITGTADQNPAGAGADMPFIFGPSSYNNGTEDPSAVSFPDAAISQAGYIQLASVPLTAGILIWETSDATVEDSGIYNVDSIGIWVSFATNVAVRRTRFHNIVSNVAARSTGLWAYLHVHNLLVEDCDWFYDHNLDQSPVALATSDFVGGDFRNVGLTARNLKITGANWGIMLWSLDGAVITHSDVQVQGDDAYGIGIGWAESPTHAVLIEDVTVQRTDNTSCGTGVMLINGQNAQIVRSSIDITSLPDGDCYENASALCVGSTYWGTPYNGVVIDDVNIHGGAVIAAIVTSGSNGVTIKDSQLDGLVASTIISNASSVSIRRCKIGPVDIEGSTMGGIMIEFAAGTVIAANEFYFIPNQESIYITDTVISTAIDINYFMLCGSVPWTDNGVLTSLTNNIVAG